MVKLTDLDDNKELETHQLGFTVIRKCAFAVLLEVLLETF